MQGEGEAPAVNPCERSGAHAAIAPRPIDTLAKCRGLGGIAARQAPWLGHRRAVEALAAHATQAALAVEPPCEEGEGPLADVARVPIDAGEHPLLDPVNRLHQPTDRPR